MASSSDCKLCHLTQRPLASEDTLGTSGSLEAVAPCLFDILRLMLDRIFLRRASRASEGSLSSLRLKIFFINIRIFEKFTKLTQIMTLCLKTSRDFDGLSEISLVGNLYDVAPASLEVLGEYWGYIFHLSRARCRRALILLRNWNGFLTSFCDKLATKRLPLDCSVKRTENAASVAEFPRVSIWINLPLRSRSLLAHIRFKIAIQFKPHFVAFIIGPLIRTIDQIIFYDLRYLWESIVGFENRKRLRQEF